MDTVTLIRSAVRGLLKVVDGAVAEELRAVLASGDDYASSAKPQIDWDDAEAREALLDSRAEDAWACLALLDGRTLNAPVAEAARLLATVTGQGLEEGSDGVFRIARRVAKDRVISTVDPQARHGHKTAARGFDGYKGHAAVDPDSEIITATVVTPGNAGDGSGAEALSEDLLVATGTSDTSAAPPEVADETLTVDGDNAYGTGAFHTCREAAGIESKCKTQRPTATGELFTRDRFTIDLHGDTGTCPADVRVAIRRSGSGGIGAFGAHCASCPLANRCTGSPSGRTIQVGPYEEMLTRVRTRQAATSWIGDYRATRPKVERKLAHLMRRRHGGRRARVRGRAKVNADFSLLAAATDLARLAVLGLHSAPEGLRAPGNG
ncbi:MAG: transposase [Candidatus Dormibacteria bacterium]